MVRFCNYLKSILCYFQSKKVVVAMGDYLGVKCCICIGGTNVQQNERELSRGSHVVVGTPGRVLDLIRRRVLGW